MNEQIKELMETQEKLMEQIALMNANAESTTHQFIFTMRPSQAAAFKLKCRENDITMSQVLRLYINEYIKRC